jgi:3-hydroxyisobutyrate dehydrogenase
MGMAVCRRIAQAGFPVIATDLRAELRPAVSAAGARWAASLTELGAASDVVLTVLPGAAEVSAITAPLVEVLAPGSAWIDLSSATPQVADRIAELAAPCGLRVLEAPMGGSPSDAESGRLLLFAGGASEDLEAHRELLETFSSRVLHVGGSGNGYLVKLLVNYLWFGQAVLASEALGLAVRCGVDTEVFRGAVLESAAASRFMEADAPALLRGDDMPAFEVKRCVDELREVLALARRLDAGAAVAGRVTELYADALEHYGDINGELLAARLVGERAGVRFEET